MNFKKILMVIFMILGLGLAAGCGGSAASPTPAKSTAQQQASLSGKKVLIAYFSWSGNTKAAAEKIQGLTGGDIYRIEAADPYPVSTMPRRTALSRNRRTMHVRYRRQGRPFQV